MKVIKNLLLGSAAVIAAGAAAQAADLPSRKAAPAEYVKICDAYGAGFFYIPGTDTCLRVGGYVRAEYAYVQSGTALGVPTGKIATNPGVAAAGALALTGAANAALSTVPVTINGVNTGISTGSGLSTLLPAGVQDQSGFLGRGRLELDARTQSPYGTVRTFIALRAQNTSGVYTGADNYISGAVTGQTGTTAITVENAIVQFAGFTFGRTTGEIFAFLPGFNYASFSSAGYPGGINLLAYTATFGGGFSGTIGIEDRAGLNYSVNPAYNPVNFANSGVVGTGLAATTGTFAGGSATNAFVNGPLTWPALTANLRYDQSWGAIQVMGQVLQNSAASTFTSVAAGGSPNFTLTQTGWALGAGIKLNLPMLAAGDTLYVTGAYANGDLDELASFSTSAPTSNNGRDLGGLLRVDRNLYVSPSATIGACTNVGAITSGCFKTEQTTGYSVAGFFTHYWTPTVRTVLLGSFEHLDPGTVTKNTDWLLGGLSSVNVLTLGGQLVWSPVKDLDIGAEVSYESLRQRLANAPGVVASCTTGSAVVCPAAYNINPNSNAFQARLRVQRQF